MTWTKPIRYEPQVLTVPPGKLGFSAKRYCDEFIITNVTSDDGMIMEGYAAGTPLDRILIGMSIISVDGTLKDDLQAECDNSREVLISKACISMDASEYSRAHLMYYKDINCSKFRIMDYSKVEKKYGKEFLEELNPPRR
jgi:hypothetical protein